MPTSSPFISLLLLPPCRPPPTPPLIIIIPKAQHPTSSFISSQHTTTAPTPSLTSSSSSSSTTTTSIPYLINGNHSRSLLRLHGGSRCDPPTTPPPPTRLQLKDLVHTLRTTLPASSQSFDITGGFETISIFNRVLKALVAADAFELALHLVSTLSSYGLAPDHRTYSLLLACYCRQGSAFQAKQVLDHMLALDLHPDVPTFTALINCFCKGGRTLMAFEVLRIMGTLGCHPTIYTYNCLLKGLCYVGKVEEAQDLLMRVNKESSSSSSSSEKPDIYSYTAVMNGLCKVGRSEEAMGLLDEALKLGLTPNPVTYNTLLNGYFKEGRPLEGIHLLKRMKQRRCWPDRVTYSTLVHGLLKWGEVRAALNVFHEMVNESNDDDSEPLLDERLMNALLRGLCRRAREDQGYLKHVYELFNRMMSAADCSVSPLAYNMVIEAFCSGNEVDKALVSFREMIRIGTRPKSITFTTVVSALSNDGKLEDAVSLLLDLMQSGVPQPMPHKFLFDTLIDELNGHGMWVGACNLYGSAIKLGVVPRRKPLLL